MEPTRRRRERRINAPLPRFLPETPAEKEAHILEQLGHRVQAYTADRHTPEWQALRDQTEQRQETVSSEHAAATAMTRKKHIQVAADPLAQLERHRLQYERVNEDTVRVGKNWYMLADGVTAYQRNVCGLMGESIGLVMEQIVADLESENPSPDEQAIALQLRRVPDMARKALKTVLQKSESFTRADAKKPLLDTDFNTTMELVYYAPWLQRAFVVHVGDSRTYKVSSDHSVRQLTRDHVFQRGLMKGIDSSVSLDVASQKQVDVFSESLAPGERLVSMSDGCFAGQERLRTQHAAIPDMKTQIEDLSHHSPCVEVLVRAVVINGEGCQQEEQFWDDASAASLERKA